MTLASLTKTLFIMKKTLLLFGISLFTIAVASAQTLNDTFTDGDYNYKVVSTSPLDVTVTGFSPAGAGLTAVNIPASATNSVGAYTVAVTSVGTHNTSSTAGAFYGNTAITSVILPSSVTVIGTAAFKNATNLVTINLENVIETKGNVFATCTKLESTGTLSSLTIMGNYTFFDCPALTSLVFPVATSIGTGSIYSNAGITAIEIPSSVTTIGTIFLGGCANLSCNNLTSIRVNWASPANVTVAPTNFLRFYTDLSLITLYVPSGRSSLYSADTSIWKNFTIVEDPSLGTHNVEQELGAAIYPNPTDGNLTLKMNTASNVDVTVYDLNGRALLNKKVNDTQSEINISNQPAGVYLLKVKADNGEFSKRIIKQ
jgi:hypothetical protein